MKKTLILIFTILFLSCQKESPNNVIEFEIIGYIKKNEGLELSIVIPSAKEETKITSKVNNGKILFKGKSKKNQYVEIRLEEDIINNKESNISYLPIFLESKVIFKIDVKESNDPNSSSKLFENIEIEEGINNKIFYKEAYNPTIGNHFTFVPNYNLKKDSLHKYVYPKEKDLFFRKFDSTFNKKPSIAYLQIITSYLNQNFPPFDKEYLSEQEKFKLSEILRNVNEELKNTNTFKELQLGINSLIKENKSLIKFENFSLPNKDGKKINLKEVIQKNNYTVLDFWWSGCAPCRKFNRNGTETYPELKKNGIEIIGVNTDMSTEIWKKGSEKDGIKWIDLFAGPNSEIQSSYNIKAFPTKIIFNSKLEIINFEFTEAKELLNFKNN